MNKKYVGPVIPVVLVWIFIHLLFASSIQAQEKDNGYKIRTVVIDPGHGGKDPGSAGKQATEKEVVLAIALKLGKYMESSMPDVRVIYTRKTDEFIPLHERAEIANSNKADLFISIHANGTPNPLVSGTETLVLGLHRAGENFEVAKKENGVILLEDDYNTHYEGFDPNSSESYIIFSLMQNLYFKQSFNIASLIQEQFRDRAHRKDRSVKQQGLLVLARTSMPGVLIETGFITNPDEEKYLMSEEGQDFIASAIFRAFRDYRKIIESRSSFTLASRSDRLPETADSGMVTADLSGGQLQENLEPLQKPGPKVEFKIQIAASTKPISRDSHVFKGLTGVTEYRVGDIYKYAVGSSPTFQDIIPFSKQIRERFPDAFIIAVKESGLIPLDQALQETQ